MAWVRPRIKDPAVEGAVSLLTPFIAYLPAESLHLSSVLAVVSAGVYLSRRLPVIVGPRVRLRGYAVWEVLVFLLNGLVFILIGLQLPDILESLARSGTSLPRLAGRRTPRQSRWSPSLPGWLGSSPPRTSRGCCPAACASATPPRRGSRCS